MADTEGFEPSIRGYRIHTFQACAFDRSATCPNAADNKQDRKLFQVKDLSNKIFDLCGEMLLFND